MESPLPERSSLAYQMQLPLESLANLVYLTKHESQDPAKVCMYMEMAEAEIVRVAAIVQKLSE
jgi:hypothetical protein